MEDVYDTHEYKTAVMRNRMLNLLLKRDQYFFDHDSRKKNSTIHIKNRSVAKVGPNVNVVTNSSNKVKVVTDEVEDDIESLNENNKSQKNGFESGDSFEKQIVLEKFDTNNEELELVEAINIEEDDDNHTCSDRRALFLFNLGVQTLDSAHNLLHFKCKSD